MTTTTRALLLAGLVALPAYAIAQHAGHGSHSSHPAPAASTSPSTAAYQAANARMHKDMDIRFTGDADVDFVRGMIPHHRGAVEMAKIVLKHGKDPVIRKLAEEVVAAQDKEIALMEGWLKQKGLR